MPKRILFWTGKMIGRLLCIALTLCNLLGPVGASEIVPRTEIEKEIRVATGALANSDKTGRLEAIRVIQHWSSYAASATPTLAYMLSDKDDELRVAAAQALEAIGPEARVATPRLVKALVESRPDVQAAAAFALVAIATTTPNVGAALLLVNTTSSPRLALAVATARQVLEPHDSLPLPERRQIAQAAVPLLLASLEEPQGYETCRLARAIAIVDSDVANSVLGRLVTATGSKNANVSANAALALQVFGPKLTHLAPVFVQAASKGSEENRLRAIRSLGWLHIETPASVAVLRKSLSNSSKAIQIAAAEALGRLGSPARASTDDLVHLALETNVKEVREAAAFAVIRIDPAQTGRFLSKLNHKDAQLAERLRQLSVLSRL